MSSAARLPRRGWLMIIVAGFLGFCAVLRAPVGVIPPLLTRLGQDLGMGEVTRGALTSVPILCFGLLTPVVSLVVRRIGINTAGLLTLTMALAGALLRSAGTTWAAFVGTVIIGAGLTVGNLVAPMVIGRDFWHRTALMTGLYSSTCNVIVTAAHGPGRRHWPLSSAGRAQPPPGLRSRCCWQGSCGSGSSLPAARHPGRACGNDRV